MTIKPQDFKCPSCGHQWVGNSSECPRCGNTAKSLGEVTKKTFQDDNDLKKSR